jgi:hypothetical protein
MAIRPSLRYPGQTDTSDAEGYPYGSAQNQSVVGDGSGTPLEKAWLSDLWGFQQALLAAAEMTASDQPDMVGASQYLDAITALLAKRITAFPAEMHDWMAAQAFRASVGIYGGLFLAPNQEALYCDAQGVTTPRERTIKVPITGFVSTVSDDNSDTGWRLYRVPADAFASVSERFEWRAVTVDLPLVGHFRVPTGAVVKTARLSISVEAGSAVRVSAGIQSNSPLNAANPGVYAEVPGLFNNIYDLTVNSKAIDGSSNVFRIEVTLISGTWAALRHASLVLADPGPRNF